MKPATRHALGALTVAVAILGGCYLQPDRPLVSGLPGRVAGQSWSAVTFTGDDERKPVVLYYGDRDKLTKLVEAGADVWTVDVRGVRAKATLTQAQAEVAERLGMQVEWLPPATMRMRADAGYRNYEQIKSRLQALAAKGAGYAELVDIGDSWEKTQGKGDRDIWALKLGKGGGNKPVVTFAGCHHAREIVTPEMVLKMAEHLVENYGTDPEVTAAIDNREIWLMPLVNPDGHVHALKGEDWRKNANSATGGKRRVGVDLNRNYATAWGTVGDSGSPDSDVFRGSGPLSEPETKAVSALLTRRPPVIYLTFHSYANSVMWAWDHKKAPPPDAAKLSALGNAMAKLSGYEAYQGAEMYLNGGDDCDWAYDKLKSLSYTIEIGDWNAGFMPPSSKLPQFWNENRPMMMHALKVADNTNAIFGPEIQATTGRNQISVTAPGVQRVESFLNRPGKAGTGKPVALSGGRGVIPTDRAGRQLLYVHGQGQNGHWGPWQILWTR